VTNIKLGDASIRITLDPAMAKREADALKRELEKIEERKKKVAGEMERLERGEQSPTATKPGPNTSGGGGRGGQFGVPEGGSSAMSPGGSDEGHPGKRGGLGTRRTIRNVIDMVVMGAKITAATTKKLAAVSETFAEKFEGTWFEGMAKKASGGIKDLAGKVIEGEAYIGAAPDTITDVIDYNTAALKLGGKFPEDQANIISEFYQINKAQEELRKSFSLATEELLFSVVEKGLTNFIQDAIKKATNQ
jgi:hypothetical protein